MPRKTPTQDAQDMERMVQEFQLDPIMLDLLKAAKEYCEPRGWTLATLATRVTGNTDWFTRKLNGGEATSRVVARFYQYMRNNADIEPPRRKP